MPETEVTKPTEIWSANKPSFEFGSSIEKARDEMNRKNPEELIHDLRHNVKRSDQGIVYAVLKGNTPQEQSEYSSSDALVMFNPFANTATANMLVRAEFIREAAKFSNVRDEAGKLKPVIMLAAPGLHGTKMQLDFSEKRLIRKGYLGPISEKYLKAVSALEYGRVALLGYSQGADLALAGAHRAYSSNLDATSLSIGEPAGVQKRSLPALAHDFFKAAPDIEKRAAESGLRSLDKARGLSSDYRIFLASAPYLTNILLAKGMSSSSFEEQMNLAINERLIDKFVVAYGTSSTITPAKQIEPALARLREQIRDERLITIKVSNGTHAWGEQLTLLAKLYLRALV